MRIRWLALGVIITAASACDNVSWGGMDVHLQSPPAADSVAPVSGAAPKVTEEAERRPDLPERPVLFAGVREGGRARLVPVGEILGDAVAPFPSEEQVPGYRAAFAHAFLAPGSEFVLFSEGARVGRLVADSVANDASFCVPRPAVSGQVELVPSAAAATRFLALPAGVARMRPYTPYRPLRHNYDQRVASLGLAATAIPRVGAAWPPSVLGMRRDIRAFQPLDASAPSIAATFVYRDGLRIGPPPPGAYSLFVVGTDRGGTYAPGHVWYRNDDEEGKGVPRYFDQLDWDGDGQAELLLDVFGSDARWFAGLGRQGSVWQRAFESPCGRRTTSR